MYKKTRRRRRRERSHKKSFRAEVSNCGKAAQLSFVLFFLIYLLT
jgi:hypothetical protein